MRMTRSLSALLVLFVLAMMVATSATSFAQVGVGISVSFGPPPLPVYDQPICPGEGYIWTPGYWAWDPDDEDYYWVPGTWVLAPEVGFLWTPPWWGWSDGVFLFHEGWWGPHVGFYGGVAYGFGYFGEGFVGGRWDHDHFFYNRSVTNINVVNIHNVYNETVNVRNVTRVSYNGGAGGIQARPRPEEERAEHERHLAPVAAQTQHFQTARRDPELHASRNQGKPLVAATPRPGDFHSAVPAKQAGGAWKPPANRGGNRGAGGTPTGGENRPANRTEGGASRPPAHASELPPLDRPVRPNTGNPKVDQKYQQQQEKLFNKQNQERQKLAQRQEQEHQRLAQQNANEARRQQTEQRHQQQTQQLQQRHAQQQERMQQRQQPPPKRN